MEQQTDSTQTWRVGYGSTTASAALPSQGPRPFPCQASAQGQPLIRPCSVAPLPGAWFLEHNPVPLTHPRFPWRTLPPHPVAPITQGSFSGPHLESTFPSLCSWPLTSVSTSQPRTHLSSPPDFSALHLPDDPWGSGLQGIRGASAPATASWTMPLLCQGGPCFLHHWGLAQGTPLNTGFWIFLQENMLDWRPAGEDCSSGGLQRASTCTRELTVAAVGEKVNWKMATEGPILVMDCCRS